MSSKAKLVIGAAVAVFTFAYIVLPIVEFLARS